MCRPAQQSAQPTTGEASYAAVGEVEEPMTGARQTIAVIIIFVKRNKNSLERQSGAYLSSMTKTPYIKRENEIQSWR
jgi:hypothetical protein